MDNKKRIEKHKKHDKIHKYFYPECEICQDRLDMCFNGEDHIYCENDSDCCRCGC